MPPIAGNQPCRAVPGEVVPRPLEEDQQPILKLDNVHQVDEEPRQPGQQAGELQRADHRHGPARPIVAMVPRSR